MARLSFSLDAAVLPMPSLSPTDLIRRKLDGPPPVEFDCGRDAQSRYFHDRAWVDQQQWLTTTYVYYLDGVAAAFATVCMDSVMLGTREKSGSIPYKWVSSLAAAGRRDLADLPVSMRFDLFDLR